MINDCFWLCNNKKKKKEKVNNYKVFCGNKEIIWIKHLKMKKRNMKIKKEIYKVKLI
jgi:hypothetical protein